MGVNLQLLYPYQMSFIMSCTFIGVVSWMRDFASRFDPLSTCTYGAITAPFVMIGTDDRMFLESPDAMSGRQDDIGPDEAEMCEKRSTR